MSVITTENYVSAQQIGSYLQVMQKTKWTYKETIKMLVLKPIDSSQTTSFKYMYEPIGLCHWIYNYK